MIPLWQNIPFFGKHGYLREIKETTPVKGQNDCSLNYLSCAGQEYREKYSYKCNGKFYSQLRSFDL